MESSIFALSSRYEGLDLHGPRHGMWSALVAIDWNGPSEIIRHREDEFLVENRNILQFADTEYSNEDEQLKKKNGSKRRKNVNRYYPRCNDEVGKLILHTGR